MRKLLLLSVALLGISFASCEYDDTDLWGAVEDVTNRVTVLENAVRNANQNIDALQTLITALQNQVTVTSVTQTADGYVIQFSDGKSATITNGVNANAPIVSVKQDADGNYYWTIDGEWLIVDGEKVRANGMDGQDGENGQDGQDGENGADGKDGEDGKDAIAPQVRVNPTTKEWEISVDGGKTWESTGVIAQGRDGYDGSNGDAYFRSVDTSNAAYVVFVLYDGTEIIVPRYDASAPSFIIEGIEELNLFDHGQTISYLVTATNVADYSISKPDGWRVVYENDSLYITAPVADHTCAEQDGIIAFNLVSKNNKSIIVKLAVKIKEIELRILTFEDADAQFTPYVLDYAGVTINKWSDLIDSEQYNGPLTYDFSGGLYTWYDENNTELTHSFTTPYWGGGHAISNYVIADYENLPEGSYGWYELQFANPIGGHNGSSNFCVHNGYVDDFNSSLGYGAHCPSIAFADGVARVVDHMYVTNINYVLNSLTYGDGFNVPASETTYVKILAYGFDAEDNNTGVAEFYLCKDGKCVTTWEKFDLSSLGAVARIEFNIGASDDQSGSYGLNCPAYFAYDDVAVRF